MIITWKVGETDTDKLNRLTGSGGVMTYDENLKRMVKRYPAMADKHAVSLENSQGKVTVGTETGLRPKSGGVSNWIAGAASLKRAGRRSVFAAAAGRIGQRDPEPRGFVPKTVLRKKQEA